MPRTYFPGLRPGRSPAAADAERKDRGQELHSAAHERRSIVTRRASRRPSFSPDEPMTSMSSGSRTASFRVRRADDLDARPLLLAFASDEPMTSMVGHFFWRPDEPMTARPARQRRSLLGGCISAYRVGGRGYIGQVRTSCVAMFLAEVHLIQRAGEVAYGRQLTIAGATNAIGQCEEVWVR